MQHKSIIRSAVFVEIYLLLFSNNLHNFDFPITRGYFVSILSSAYRKYGKIIFMKRNTFLVNVEKRAPPTRY